MFVYKSYHASLISLSMQLLLSGCCLCVNSTVFCGWTFEKFPLMTMYVSPPALFTPRVTYWIYWLFYGQKVSSSHFVDACLFSWKATTEVKWRLVRSWKEQRAEGFTKILIRATSVHTCSLLKEICCLLKFLHAWMLVQSFSVEFIHHLCDSWGFSSALSSYQRNHCNSSVFNGILQLEMEICDVKYFKGSSGLDLLCILILAVTGGVYCRFLPILSSCFCQCARLLITVTALSRCLFYTSKNRWLATKALGFQEEIG